MILSFKFRCSVLIYYLSALTKEFSVVVMRVAVFSFHWCPNETCSEDGFGFVDEGAQLRISCPICKKAIKCRQCVKDWSPEHANKTCEEFATWERESRPEYRDGGASLRLLILFSY